MELGNDFLSEIVISFTGSPLVCPVVGHSGHYYQAGIVAWGIGESQRKIINFKRFNRSIHSGCGEHGTPGVYVNVAKFRHWIDEQLRLRNLQSQSYII